MKLLLKLCIMSLHINDLFSITCDTKLFNQINTFLSSVIGVGFKTNLFPYEPLYLFPSESGNKDNFNESIILNAGYTTYPNAFSSIYLWDVVQCNDYNIKITVAIDGGPFATRIDFTYLDNEHNKTYFGSSVNYVDYSTFTIQMMQQVQYDSCLVIGEAIHKPENWIEYGKFISCLNCPDYVMKEIEKRLESAFGVEQHEQLIQNIVRGISIASSQQQMPMV